MRKKNVDSEFSAKSSCNNRSVGDARSRRNWDTALPGKLAGVEAAASGNRGEEEKQLTSSGLYSAAR